MGGPSTGFAGETESNEGKEVDVLLHAAPEVEANLHMRAASARNTHSASSCVFCMPVRARVLIRSAAVALISISSYDLLKCRMMWY